MGLEQMSSSVEANTDLKWEINEAIKKCTDEVDKVALDTISNLNENQLATYIRTSFYDQNEGAWENYSSMRNNKYHAFMVQAAIDLLSDKYGDNKYNINGVEWDGDDFRSLDDWIWKEWIDNRMWWKTSTAVKVLQNKWHFIADWYAGPQFFAKVCAELENSALPTTFKVKGKENYSNKYGFNRKQSVSLEGLNGGESQTVEFDTPTDVEIKYEDWAYRIYRNTENTGFYLTGKPWSFRMNRPLSWEGSKWDFEINNTNNTIIYKGSSETNRWSLEIFDKTVNLPSGYTFGEEWTYNNEYAKDKKSWPIFYNWKYCWNTLYYNESLNKYCLLSNNDNENYKELYVQDDAVSGQIFVKEFLNNTENIDHVTAEIDNNSIINNLDRFDSSYYRFAVKSNGSVKYYYVTDRYIHRYNHEMKHESKCQYNRYDQWLSLLVKNSLNVGRFGDLFGLKYSDIKDHLSDDDATLWNAAIKKWWPENRAKVGAWLKKTFTDHSWWADFCEWCRNMQTIYHMNEEALTLWNWMAFSDMNIDLKSWDLLFDKLANS